MIVVDASMAFMWVVDDETHAEADASLALAATEGASVPANFFPEITHALLRAERRGRIDRAFAATAITELSKLRIRSVMAEPIVILTLAREFKLSAYDAAYLAVASEINAPLATADRHLRAAASSMNLLWVPEKKKREK